MSSSTVVGDIRVNFYINKQGDYFNERNETITNSITLEGFNTNGDSFNFYILNNPIFLDPTNETFYDPSNSDTIGGLTQNDISGTPIDSFNNAIEVTSDTSNVLFNLYNNSYQGTGVFSYYASDASGSTSNIGYVFVNIRYAATDGCDVEHGRVRLNHV